MSAANGDMLPDSPDGHGVWLADMRRLSEYRLRINGEESKALEVKVEAGSILMTAEAAGLRVDRHRYVEDGLRERITITNPGRAPVDAELTLTSAADGVDMMALRGFAPVSATPPEVNVARHQVSLRPGDRFTLQEPDFDAGLARFRDSYRRWANDCARIETDNLALNELLERSRDDLRMLMDFYPTGIYPSAGIPWYAVPFGRDGLFVALFTLWFNPDLARGTLRYLAAHQGVTVDPAGEQQPGKILHEVRTGSAVDQGLWPQIFYGDVDGAALFIWLLAETFAWTGDDELRTELSGAARSALEWCDRYGDSDGDGYVDCYPGRSRNQAWKDSEDSLTHADGTDAGGNAALCEVQGYLYRALVSMVEPARAADLKRRFNRDYKIPGVGYIAQALDRNKRRVEAISSNPGHCLWAGILTARNARSVAERLVSPEMFTGWGVRDLSSRAINYDPRNGSNGCIIPFDNAIVVAGLRRAGFAVEAELVARSVLEAGMAFPHRRLPEYFCGFDRVEGSPPEEHPMSCSPQAWSAAAAFSLVASLLGLEADARRGRLRISPLATALWNRVEVSGLHFAGHRIDFVVEGAKVRLGAVPKGVTIQT